MRLQSFINPAERIMSILNLAVQNVSTERKETPDIVEKRKIRKANEYYPDYLTTIFTKEEWKKGNMIVVCIV